MPAAIFVQMSCIIIPSLKPLHQLCCLINHFILFSYQLLLQNSKDIKAELQQAARDPYISDLLWPDIPAAPVLGSQPSPAHPPQGTAAAA